MKTLLVLRHAKSSWKEADVSDHDRPLNPRGQLDAPHMGRLLRELALLPDLIASSTARRARATATAVAENSGYSGEIRFYPEMYQAQVEELLNLLRGLPNSIRCVLLVGHNPEFEGLVETLIEEYVPLKTATLVQIELPIINWEDVEDTTGAVIGVWNPRDSSAL